MTVVKNSSGKLGEDYAEKMLRRHGYKILEKNYHSRFGEIDIVAQNRQYIVFVEVKTREEDGAYHPFEAITPAKQRKIALTASHYLAQHPSPLQPRFDAAAVLTREGKAVKIEYLKNAFLISGH